MNILSFIFALLLIISYGFFATWNSHLTQNRIQRTYVNHQIAHRKLLNTYNSELYGALRSKRVESENPTPRGVKATVPELNAACSRLNIYPLIQEGKSAHPLLYNLTAKLFKEFYDVEPEFLDLLLKDAALEPALEKLPIKGHRKAYYKMLKGSKTTPALLDYIKSTPTKEKICLHHAHPRLLSLLFNKESAAHLFTKLHEEKTLPTQELIEDICKGAYLSLDPKIFDLLELQKAPHEELSKILTATEDDVYLRISQPSLVTTTISSNLTPPKPSK